MEYNGLKSDLNSLAKFVFIYETEIKKMVNETDFKQFNEQAFYSFKHKIQAKIKNATINEIKNSPESSKQTLYFTKQKNQILDFCRHLRNAFSHGLLRKESKKMIIIDKNRGNCTSKGYVEYDITKKFIVEIIKEFENNR